MPAATPMVWAADLIVPVDPRGSQTDATAEGAAFARSNEIWNADDSTVQLTGASNEVLTFQLVVEKRAGRIESISADTGDVECALFQHIAVPVGDGIYDDALVPVIGNGTEIAMVSRRAPNFTGRKRQTFTVELYVPKGTPAGQRQLSLTVQAGGETYPLTISLTVHGFELPDKPSITADINNYSTSPAQGFFDPDGIDDYDRYLRVMNGYFRMAREHRAHYHLLPYAQSGRMAHPLYAPVLSGRGRDRHVADWSGFDRTWGPLLDGSVFEGVHGYDGPIEYLYLPVNANWPAYFEKYGRPGYWHEYRQVLGEIADHLAERGWTQTKFEVFFNHKTRWKYFPWDMDEIRFERDNQATIDFARAALEATAHQSGIQVINRIDSSWIFPKSARCEIGDIVQLWVVNRGSHSEAPDEVELLRSKGQEVWFYGGAGMIAATDRLDSLRWPWIAWGRQTDGFCWWNGTHGDNWDKVGPGTGHCFYPGARFGVDGPLASIRLKVLHRGMQDHAYLTLLDQKTGSRAASDECIAATVGCKDREDWYQREEAAEVSGADIQVSSKTTKPWNTATRDKWNNARAAVARAIEKA